MAVKRPSLILSAITIVVCGAQALAQAPPWTAVTGQELNVVAAGTVFRNGVQLATSRYWVGAYGPGGFAADCRAFGPINSDGFYYLTIRGGAGSELIHFRLWDTYSAQSYDADETITFVGDATHYPFSLHFTQPSTELPTRFVPVTPCRVFDTRIDSGSEAGAPVISAGDRRVFTIAGKCGVPVAAQAVSVNLTVVGATAIGDLRVTAGHVTTTETSALSIPLSRARANNAVIQLSTAGDGTLAATNATTGTVHLILDVNGYFL
jgi:hypothetical protein